MDYLIKEETLTDIADAIRGQTGDENPIAASDFAAQIASITGGSNTMELTQAQYDALSTAEKNNGTIYFITDVNGTGDNFQPVIFSSEEREIGVWTDGKPLYQRTYAATWSTSNTSIQLDFTPDVIFFKMAGSYKVDSQSNVGYLGYYVDGNNNTRAYYKYSDNTIVCQATGSGYVGSGKITIQYTKAGDTPGSGVWTPQGVPAIHYSREEHVIGTWIDGSTIYEKTYVVSTSLSSGGTQVIDASFSGAHIIGWSGYNVANNGSNYILPDGRFRVLLPQPDYKLTIASINGGTWDGTSYITIRYIKAST